MSTKKKAERFVLSPPHGFNNGFKYFSKCGTLDANIGKWHLVVVEYEKEDRS